MSFSSPECTAEHLTVLCTCAPEYPGDFLKFSCMPKSSFSKDWTGGFVDRKIGKIG
jgi:hypothetical protein